MLSSGGNEVKLYRRIVYTIHCPATIKAGKMCPRKDIERAVGYVSLKPTGVAADRSRSAQGVARLSHTVRIDNGMSGIRPEDRADTRRLCLTYIG